MKNLILCFIFVVAGALLISVTNGFSHSSYTDCQTVTDCTRCHSWTYCDICPTEPSCDTTPTPTCNDGDGDGYGDPGDASCDFGSAQDCNDNNAEINPDATERCASGLDYDCDGKIGCEDSDCFQDSFCVPETCGEYLNRRACNQDSRCEWDRTLGCQDYVDLSIYTDKDSCLAEGGRWNKRKAICR